jgi:competence protein ComGC
MTEINAVDVIAKKPWYKSKIIWFNTACAALAALEASMNLIQPYVPGNVYGWALLFVTMVNACLRIITTQAIIKPQMNSLLSKNKGINHSERGFVLAEIMPYLVTCIAAGFLLYGIYSMGVDAERSRWELAENKKLVEAKQKILDLQNEKYDLEQKRISDLAELTAIHNQEIKDREDKANAVIAKLRAGTLKLRISAVRPADCGSAASEVSTPDGGVEETYRAQLTTGASEFLITRFKERDQLAISFNTCIEQLHKDRGLTFTNPYRGETK